jgi:hypothetical protein
MRSCKRGALADSSVYRNRDVSESVKWGGGVKRSPGVTITQRGKEWGNFPLDFFTFFSLFKPDTVKPTAASLQMSANHFKLSA